MPDNNSEKLKLLIKQLYATQYELKKLFPDFSFTLDGKIIGDIGEVIAMRKFNLTPLERNMKTHDLIANDIKVQVKTTQYHKHSHGVGMGWHTEEVNHLLVFQLTSEGGYETIFDGPGNYISQFRKKRQRNLKQKKATPDLTTNQLRKLHEKVKPTERLAHKLKMPSVNVR